MEFNNKLKPVMDDLTKRKQKQLELILKTNPAYNDVSTWVRSLEDILTLEEALEHKDWSPYNTKEDPMFKNALKTRKLKVYGSKPIIAGNWVTPNLEEARAYAGSKKVYEADVDIDDVAWIDPYQGQYAKVK